MSCGALRPDHQPRLSDPSEIHVAGDEHRQEQPDRGGSRRRKLRTFDSPAMWLAHIQTMNGSAIAAVGLISMPIVTRTTARTCLRSRAARTPMVRNASIIRSLCGPPKRWMTIIGLATASHSATGSLPPRCLTSRGSAHSVAGQADQQDQAHQDDAEDHVVAGNGDDALGDQQEQRPVRRRGGLPERVDVLHHVRQHVELGGPVGVRVEAVEQLGALAEVGEDVAGEQRRRDEQRRHPAAAWRPGSGGCRRGPAGRSGRAGPTPTPRGRSRCRGRRWRACARGRSGSTRAGRGRARGP